jgi:hypothetical protein
MCGSSVTDMPFDNKLYDGIFCAVSKKAPMFGNKVNKI